MPLPLLESFPALILSITKDCAWHLGHSRAVLFPVFSPKQQSPPYFSVDPSKPYNFFIELGPTLTTSTNLTSYLTHTTQTLFFAGQSHALSLSERVCSWKNTLSQTASLSPFPHSQHTSGPSHVPP